MKSLTKTTAYKSYQSTIDEKSEIGKKMQALREDIKDLIDQQKGLERQQNNPDTSKVSGLLSWKKNKKTAEELQDEIDIKTEGLQQLHNKVNNLQEQADSDRAEMYKQYVEQCELIQKELFSKLDEARKVNDKLKELEEQFWEPLSLARAGYVSPYLPQMKQVDGWEKQFRQLWDRMKDRKS